MTDFNKLIEEIDIRVQKTLEFMAAVEQISGKYVRCMDDLERLTKVRASYIDQMYVVNTMIGQIAERTAVKPAGSGSEPWKKGKKLVWNHDPSTPRIVPTKALDLLFLCPEKDFMNVEHIVCNRTNKMERQYIAVECAHHVTTLMGVENFPEKWVSYIYTMNRRTDGLKPFQTTRHRSYWLEDTPLKHGAMEVIKGFNRFTETGDIYVFIHTLNAWTSLKGGFLLKHLRECAILALRDKAEDDEILWVPR